MADAPSMGDTMDLARLREKKESTDDADNNLDGRGRGVTNNDDTANI